MELVAQLVGFGGLTLAIIAFQINNRKKLILLHMAAATIFTLHFFMLGAFTGASLNAINIARNYIFAKKYDYKWARSPWVLATFITLFVIAGALTWDGWYSVLPVIGMVAGSVAFWMKNTTTIRFLALIAPPCWFAYNFIVGSIPGMIAEILIFSSIVAAIIRYDILKHKHIAKK
jgi:hypothetical protein